MSHLFSGPCTQTLKHSAVEYDVQKLLCKNESEECFMSCYKMQSTLQHQQTTNKGPSLEIPIHIFRNAIRGSEVKNDLGAP